MSEPVSDQRPQATQKPKQEQEPLSELLTLVDRLPFVGSLRRDVMRLRALLYDRRAPRVVAIGAPKSGRTQLANALLGKEALPHAGLDAAARGERWVHINADGARLDWTEIDVGAATASGTGRTELERRRELVEARPDIALLVVRADDDAPLAPLVESFERLRTLLGDGGPAPRVLGVITHADVAGSERTARRRDALEQALREHGIVDVAVLAVGTGAEPSALGEEAARGVRILAESLVELVPDAAQLELARALPLAREGKRRIARAIVSASSAVALTVGLAPIPFADAVLLFPLQGVMVSSIAHVSGRPWRAGAVGEWLGSLGVVGGVGLGMRWAVQQLVKLVPGAGSMISASVAAAGTAALGHSAVAYFVDGASLTDAKKIFAREN